MIALTLWDQERGMLSGFVMQIFLIVTTLSILYLAWRSKVNSRKLLIEGQKDKAALALLRQADITSLAADARLIQENVKAALDAQFKELSDKIDTNTSLTEETKDAVHAVETAAHSTNQRIVSDQIIATADKIHEHIEHTVEIGKKIDHTVDEIKKKI